jgi:hypothetical protein
VNIILSIDSRDLPVQPDFLESRGAFELKEGGHDYRAPAGRISAVGPSRAKLWKQDIMELEFS